MRQRTFWIAFAVGAIAGGVAALLYAPQSGTATRKKLKRSMEDLSDNLQDAGDYLKEQAEKLSKQAQDLINASKDQFGTAVDTATGYVRTGNKAASKGLSKLM